MGAIGGPGQYTPQALRRRFLAEMPSRQATPAAGSASVASASPAGMATGDSSVVAASTASAETEGEEDVTRFQNE